MVLSINIPEDVKSIFNSMKQPNKNRILSNLSNEINIIYHDTIGDVYGDKIFSSQSQNYTSLENMYGAMHILINNGKELQVFLDEDVFETPVSPLNNEFENNLLGENIISVYQQDEHKEDFTQLQVEFKSEINNYLSNDFKKNINKMPK
jgi:hypothetical protein